MSIAFFRKPGFMLAIPLTFIAILSWAILFFVEHILREQGIKGDIQKVNTVSELNKCVDEQTQVNTDVILSQINEFQSQIK